MTSLCPHCGGVLPGPSAHRSELERQLGDAERAHALRQRAAAWGMNPEPLDLGGGFIAFRGYVWVKVRVRKAAICRVTGVEIPAGGWAWRQLSEVENRDWRVSAAAWAHVVTPE